MLRVAPALHSKRVGGSRNEPAKKWVCYFRDRRPVVCRRGCRSAAACWPWKRPDDAGPGLWAGDDAVRLRLLGQGSRCYSGLLPAGDCRWKMPTRLGEEGQWLSAAGASAEIHDRPAATGGGDDLPAAARLADAALSAAGGLPVQPDRLRHRAAWHWYRHGSGGSPGLGSLTGCATTAYSKRKPERHRR